MAKRGDFSLQLEPMAHLLEMTPRRLQQLAKEGVVPVAIKGRYEMIGCVQGYIKYLRARAVGTELTSEAFTQQRARKTAATADMAEMERDRQRGIYLHAEEVKMAWIAIAQNVKQRLLLIPAKIAVRLLSLKKASDVQTLLRDEITEALEEISKYNVAVPPGSSDSGERGAAGVRAAAPADSI